jgi:hypothetical protein
MHACIGHGPWTHGHYFFRFRYPPALSSTCLDPALPTTLRPADSSKFYPKVKVKVYDTKNDSSRTSTTSSYYYLPSPWTGDNRRGGGGGGGIIIVDQHYWKQHQRQRK